MIGLFSGFKLNKEWTFKAQINDKKTYIYQYILVYLFSLFNSQLILFSLVEIALFTPLHANIFAISASTMMNFFGTKLLVFKKQ